jgi:hypothetical protein
VSRRTWPLALLVAAALALVLAAQPLLAQDKPTLAGTWSATALTERWVIGDWGDPCGPKPTPQGAGAGSVQIREQGGELSIIGAGRAFTTAECWEQMPGLSRTSHSASGGGRFWRTRCNTGKADSRQATVVTSITATDTTINLTETGQYQFVIQDQNCTASVTRARNFSLVRREGDAAPVPSAAASASAAPTATPAAPPQPAPPPRPTPTSCTGEPGEPARLEVTPSRKLMRPGERFAFRSAVYDASGCPVGARPTWTIGAGPMSSKASVDAGGSLHVADDAGEGKLELAAAIGGKGVTILVEVASAERYEALLASEGLNDAGEGSEAAVAVIATGTIGGKASVAEDAAKARKRTFIAIVGALAFGLAFAGLVLLRRGRRQRTSGLPAEGASAVPLGDDEDGSGTGDDDAGAPSSGESAGPAASTGARSPGGASPGARSPGGASPGARSPGGASSAPPGSRTAGRKRGKICPTCGGRYGMEDAFCGKDGTTLVPIN